MRRITKKPSLQYLITAVITLIAVYFQYLIIHEAKIASSGILYPCTFLIAWFFGFGQALLAIFIAVICSNLFYYEPILTFKVLDFNDTMRIAIFAVTSMLAAFVVARGRDAEDDVKVTKNALSDLEERFQRSSAATNLGIWYCDLPFDELIWNKEVKEHFWLPPHARVTIDIFYERIHPDDREKTRAAIQKSIENDESYDIIYRTTNPQDTTQVKYIRAIGWTEYDDNNKPIRFDGITLDNTSIHKLSEERNESLEVLEKINAVGKILSAELDPNKLVQSVTDAATQLSKAEFGAFFYNVINQQGESYTLYSVSGVSRENFSKFPMPRNTEVFAPTFAGTAVVRSDDITKDPRYGKNAPYKGMPEGHLPVKSYLAVPVVSRSGEVIGGLFFGHKLPGMFSEREEKLVTGLASQAAIAMDNARLFDKAKEAIQIRDEFMSISSHELRTPLTPLKMQIQSLARHIDKGTIDQLPIESIRKMVTTADRQVNRLTTLVDDLLDVSRISTGRLTLNFEEVDLSQLINEICDRYLPQLQNSHNDLRLNLLDSLITQADKLRFEQVLINLLTNAMKYAPHTPVTVSLVEVGGYAIIEVADEGPGISEIDQKRIFDRFERVTSEASQTGLGLGLYIVNQIVNAHGGSIKVESYQGKGSKFIISIPIKR